MGLDRQKWAIDRAEWVHAASYAGSGLALGPLAAVSWAACPFSMYLLVFFKCSHYSGLR